MNLYQEHMYLMHYGIKRRSGRYKYGTGDRPYQHNTFSVRKFKNAENDVRSKLSNDYKEFKVEGFNKIKADDRAGTDTNLIIQKSSEKFETARKIEPIITQDVVGSISNTTARMYGLEHRIKQPTSLTGKIGSDITDKGIGIEEAVNSINDAIRYTAVSEDKDFVKNYNKIKKNLETKGYKETKCKNYFEQYRQGRVKHKAVQSNFADRNGYVFELQFQTPASQAAKELKIPIYEERRKQGISQARAKFLEQQMIDLAEHVPDPPNIERIKAH